MPGFPNDFVWGVASAAYQVEGGFDADGRGLSVWDTAAHRKGFTYEEHTGDVACDTYHRYEQDSRLMKELGVGAYRLSLSWPRILPEGVGQVNQAGLDYYDRLIDSLLAHGITPWVTLFHWDYPQALFERGGWLNPESPKWFAEYTRVVVERLSDRVSHWMTLNEPQCFLGLGHAKGAAIHAPGYPFERRLVLLATHHALLAHGRAVQEIRAHTQQPAKIGWAPTGPSHYPADPANPAHVEAARDLTFRVPQDDRYFWNFAWYSDPVLLGRYPEEALTYFGKDAPTIRPGDMETMRQPLDFFGVNVYNGKAVSVDERGTPVGHDWPAGYPLTAMGWPVSPEALGWTIRFLGDRYNLPLVITENGIASIDWVHADGKVHDPARIDFLTRYIRSMRDAIDAGSEVLGYFQWSIMDNFEWAEGYSKRFGLVYIDYATQERIPKDSFYWYKALIASNGESLPEAVTPLR